MPTSARFQEAAYALLVLAALGISVASRDARYLAAAALVGLAIKTLLMRDVWTPGGLFGWANALTWVRILASAALVLMPMSGLATPALAFAIFALDGADGAIARARGTASAFGAELDKECDALFILVLCVLLVLGGVAGSWLLIAGMWRYGYALIIALGAHIKAAPRSSWARYTYSTSSLCLIAALIENNSYRETMAAFALLAISASFTRSLYYSFCRN